MKEKNIERARASKRKLTIKKRCVCVLCVRNEKKEVFSERIMEKEEKFAWYIKHNILMKIKFSVK